MVPGPLFPDPFGLPWDMAWPLHLYETHNDESTPVKPDETPPEPEELYREP